MTYLNSTQQIVKETGDFLAKTDWTFFATLTTPFNIDLKRGRRLMERFHDYLQKKGFKPTIFWVLEPFLNSKNGYHVHALIKLDVSESIKTLLEALKTIWRQISKGSAISSKTSQISPYIREKGANYYVSKFVCSESAEFDIFNENDKFS